jgi:hypothetical protein
VKRGLRARALGTAAAAALLGVACNAVIGLHDVPAAAPEEGDGGDAAPDGTMTPATDGGLEATGATDSADALGALGDATGAPDAVSDALSADAHPCTSTQADSYNCGRCGHDCLGGACALSQCTPFVLWSAEGGASPFSLEQDDGFLYWADEIETVGRTDKNTGATIALTESNPGARTLAVDDSSVWWGDYTGIWTCPKSGCGSGPSLVTSDGQGIDSLSIDGTYLYWADVGSGPLREVRKFGHAETGVALVDAGASRVVADGQRVYFLTPDGGPGAVTVDDAGAPDPFPPSGGTDLYGGVLYWVGPAMDAIYAAPTATLVERPLVVGRASAAAVRSDGANLYWIEAPGSSNTDGKIVACAIGSCSPAPVATGYHDPTSLVVDDVAVYWNDSDGKLWKLAK